MNYNNLKAAIAAAIKENGNNEITGDVLQSVLLSIVSALGDGYQYEGIITPSSTITTGDNKVMYIAQEGTYTINGVTTTVKRGYLGLFRYDSVWNFDVLRIYSPTYTDNPTLNGVVNELYFRDWQSDYDIRFFSISGGKFTMTVYDSSDNLILFINDEDVTAGELFVYEDARSGKPLTMYMIPNGEEYVISGTHINAMQDALGFQFNPICEQAYLRELQEESKPLCVSRFDDETLLPNCLYNASYITISRRYTQTHDSVFVFANKMAAAVSNHFFDLLAVGLHERGERKVSKCSSYIDYTSLNSSPTTDSLLMPIVVSATNNIDGDNTDKWFTGGNHAYGNQSTGTPTMKELYNIVRLDGELVNIGDVNRRGSVLTIDVANEIQAYNTCKQAGGGRAVIVQRAHIVATATDITADIELEALEDVTIENPLYGCAWYFDSCDYYRFIGSVSKKGKYLPNVNTAPTSTDNHINANAVAKNDHLMYMEFADYGIAGKKLTSEANAFALNGKMYEYLANESIVMASGDIISHRVKIGIDKI